MPSDDSPPSQSAREGLEQRPDRRLRPRERLRLRVDFARVFAERRSVADDRLVVYVCPNGLAWTRLGISVSRRLGNAVHRHRIRRRIREAFRLNKADLPVGLDVLCVAREGAGERGADVAGSLTSLVARAARRRRST